MLTLNPDKIRVPERIRDINPDHLALLKESIQEMGQLTPILVRQVGKDEYELVGGLHRLEACKQLGIPVKAVVVEEMSDLDEETQKLAMEIAENTARQDFTLAEKQKAIYELHQKLKQKDPKHSISKTAKLLGLNRSYVSELINAWEQGITAETYRELRKKRKKQEQVIKNVVEVLKEAQKLQSPETPDDEKIPLYVRHCNAFDLMNDPDFKHQFNVILTDIPYGLEVQDTAYLKEYERFDDSNEWMTEGKVIQVLRLIDYLLNETGWAVVFCSLEQWFIAKRLLAGSERLLLQKFPLIWHKAQSVPPTVGSKWLGHAYEVAMVLKRPEAEVLRAGSVDVVQVNRLSDKLHPTEKPVLLGKQILERLVLPIGRGIDPFAGSGALALAMAEYGLETFAVELNPHYYEVMTERLKKEGWDVREV